jgi:hypothetical protein
MTMETVSAFPSGPHWTAQQLTDAAPLRLFEAINFQALHYGQLDASANDPRVRQREPRSYLPRAAHAAFRVR